MTRINFAFFATLSLLVAVSSASDPDVATRKIYRAEETKAFSSEPYAHQLKGVPPYWTPNSEQVRALEEALPGFLQESWPADHPPIENLDRYVRQYFGITSEAGRAVVLNAACDSYASSNPEWRKHFIFVFDGGSCFFQLEYDPLSKQFRNLSVNGFG